MAHLRLSLTPRPQEEKWDPDEEMLWLVFEIPQQDMQIRYCLCKPDPGTLLQQQSNATRLTALQRGGSKVLRLC